ARPGGFGELVVRVGEGSRAGAVGAQTFAVRGPFPALPDDILMRVVVDGDVVVHVVVAREGAAHAGEDAGVEDSRQGFGLRRDGDVAAEQLSGGEFLAVHLLVRVPAFDEHAALERHAGEQAFGLAVGEDAAHALQTRGARGFGIASHRPRRNAHVPTQRQTAHLREGLDRARIIQYKDKVRQLEADLSAKPSSDGPDGGGCGPRAVRQTGDDHAGAKATGSEEAGFEDGEDGEALGVGEDGGRDDLVGTEGLSGVDEGGEDATALFAFA
ncbi:hypothetical protein Tdes44962_MAKER10298, partial [Teratosphaeria destructans]